MHDGCAEVRDDHLHLPGELGEAMGLGSKVRLLLEPDELGGFASRLDLRRLLKRRLQRRPVKVATASHNGDGWAVSSPAWLGEGRYRIVNYDPRFLLIRSDTEDPAADRAAFWAAISDYHEHRQHAEQDADAVAFSRWFARDIIGPFKPKRVLELGCGAGRNLAQIAALDGVEVVGVEINPGAAEQARQAVCETGSIVTGSLYDLDGLGSFDVVFTAGVLMHVPHDEVEAVVRSMVEHAEQAVVHFELHGTPHGFDFHRYPRDYGDLYRRLGLDGATYRVLDRTDPLNAGESVGRMALLTYGR